MKEIAGQVKINQDSSPKRLVIDSNQSTNKTEILKIY